VTLTTPTGPIIQRVNKVVLEFLAAYRAEFGWHPAVDCCWPNWDPDFPAGSAQSASSALPAPNRNGGHGLGYLHRYTGVRRSPRISCSRRPLSAHWIADLQVAPSLLIVICTTSIGRRLLPLIRRGRLYSAIGMSEHGAGRPGGCRAGPATQRRRRLGAQRLEGLASGAHVGTSDVVVSGPYQPTRLEPRSIGTRASHNSRATSAAGHQRSAPCVYERRASLPTMSSFRRVSTPTPTCAARSATVGTRSSGIGVRAQRFPTVLSTAP